jgi:sugar transferase (PEP-CTERM/EpsH1 system associated)
MHILWLKSDLLLPLDKGGKLRTWHLMRHLATRHEITYLSFADNTQRPEDLKEMRRVASRVVTVPFEDAPKGSLRFYTGVARHLTNRLPYAVAKYHSPAYRAAIDAELKDRRVDLVVCDFLVPAVNLPEKLPCPAVLFTHNVEAEIWRRHAEQQRSPVGRWLYRLQHRRMRAFEGEALGRFDEVLAVSEQDRETFGRLYPGATRKPPFVVQTGVDTSYFVAGDRSATSRTLVFTGSMDWIPNEDAMAFFCRDILPLIRAREPDTQLTIVGRAPTRAVRNLAALQGVRVTGRVDDVRPFMAEASVYIVPLRIGGGTRLKIFEAMAMGKAVVSTTIGAEGLPVVDGQHLVLADQPQAFADAVVRLLGNAGDRRRLGQCARELVTSRFDWPVVAAELEAALLAASTRFEDKGAAA